eukprot:6197174-Pleurochrysis_carterae.AAC.1
MLYEHILLHSRLPQSARWLLSIGRRIKRYHQRLGKSPLKTVSSRTAARFVAGGTNHLSNKNGSLTSFVTGGANAVLPHHRFKNEMRESASSAEEQELSMAIFSSACRSPKEWYASLVLEYTYLLAV